MRIDRKLNLVVPVEREDGALYVHAAPLSREVFERYFLVISKTFAAIYGERLNVVAGPRVAALMLRKVAQDMGVWDGPEGAALGLMGEIRRLSNVMVPRSGGGWEMVPLDSAISSQMLDEDEVSEVEGAIAFFMVASAMHKRADLPPIWAALEAFWDAEATSLNAMGYVSSLKTSTGGETTGAKETASSIPS